ncbi:MAG: DUF5615 family PIN-like protein [Planctomycetia bacterium]|nr:DUF5615 family PIN-like protein [Planctomycetia bacterium]
MKLLFDQNLSQRLVTRLAVEYPQSVQVRDIGLQTADDQATWEYAVQQQLTIVSKDSDFEQRSLLYGHPPKVIWIRMGNCATTAMEQLLRARISNLRAFELDATASVLVLS